VHERGPPEENDMLTSWNTNSVGRGMSIWEQCIRVLMIEDCMGDAALMQNMLRRAGRGAFEVQHILRLRDMDGFRSSEVDVVLLDLSLPDGKGLSSVEKVRARLGNAPIVVLTGTDDEQVGLEAVGKGAQDYLIKRHIDQGVLVRALRYARARAYCEELEQHQARADRLIAIGKLAAGVAHEINNPATFIMGNCTVLKEYLDQIRHCLGALLLHAAQEPDPARRRSLQALLDTAQVDDLLDELGGILQANIVGVERIATVVKALNVLGNPSFQAAELVQLNELVHEACTVVGREIEKRAHLVCDLGALPLVAADRIRLVQTIINLLRNATEALVEDRRSENKVVVTTRHTIGRVVLSVEDNGRGIPPHIHGRIFDPFFTTKPVGQGIGLGLTHCAETVRRHRGQIAFQSMVGWGSRFEVILPEDTGIPVAVPDAAK
jgi:signal transduction histidine kinase